jgi:LuxR family maltose regulon positive regulatory protein
LANDLAEVDIPVVLVIDDLHLAGPSPSVLVAFINALPHAVRLVVSSRQRPPFSLARRRLAGDLLELHTEDLRFSTTEADQLVGHHGIELTSDDLTRLQALTEGWPAALQLAVASPRRTSDSERFFDDLASTDGPMADFLLSEVLAALPDDWVEFLLVTSVLDEFDVALCERMTGRADSFSILRQLTADGLFVVPLDEFGAWYRYHHLFGALMRARLQARGVSQVRHIHAEASSALEERGLVVPAMRQAFANDDAEMAAAIARRALGRSMYPVDNEVTAAAARLWLHKHGRDTVTSDPMSVLKVVVLLAATTESDDVARWLQEVAQAHPEASDDVTGYLQGVWADYHLSQGQVGAALGCIDSAMSMFDGLPPNRALMPLLYPAYVRAHLSAGDVDEARATLDRVRSHSVGNPVLDDVRLPAQRAWISLLDGDLSQAMRLSADSLGRADEMALGQNEPGRMFAHVTIAGVHTERRDDAAAAEAFEMATRCADLAGRSWYRCMILLQRASEARLTGDSNAAEGHLMLARLAVLRPSTEFEAMFELEAARQAVRFEPGSAAALLDLLGDAPAAIALRAQLALERDDKRSAREHLALLPAPTTTRQSVEYNMLHALAADDREFAQCALESALNAAAPEGFVRAIIDAGAGVPGLLVALTPGRAHHAYVDTLLEASSAVVPPARLGRAEPLIDPLSQREVVVLRYLSSRLTNAEIAAALYISVNTLKSHVKAIYRKLAVSSRADAVEAGRNLRLI